MRLNLRVALFLLIGLVAVGGVWSGVQPQSGEPESTGLKTATLVIDFGSAAGKQSKIVELSDVPASETGWDLLVRSGIDVEGTSQYPTGFVCRLDGWPTAELEDCDETPSYADGHWAYYVTSRDLGGDWILSGQGAAAHVVECGGFEGWKWVGPREISTPPAISPEIRECAP